MQEVETQRYITEVLDKYGIVYRTVGTGVIAMIGQGEKCVAIRADMDALKVTEETGLPFCSLTPGMMHACGHDMHMAMVLGAAVVLKSREQELNGMVKVIFQPSEEKRPGGARLLLPELLKAPVPQAIPIFIAFSSGDIFGLCNGGIFSCSGGRTPNTQKCHRMRMR